jgi:hypothetical protein
MKEKKAKLKLEDIKVESFVTSLNDNEENRIMGASLPNDCATGSKIACCVPTLPADCYTGTRVACCVTGGTCGSNPCC